MVKCTVTECILAIRIKCTAANDCIKIRVMVRVRVGVRVGLGLGFKTPSPRALEG